MSGNRDLEIIVTELIGADGYQDVDVTVPNIKAFFQLTSAKKRSSIKKY